MQDISVRCHEKDAHSRCFRATARTLGEFERSQSWRKFHTIVPPPRVDCRVFPPGSPLPLPNGRSPKAENANDRSPRTGNRSRRQEAGSTLVRPSFFTAPRAWCRRRSDISLCAAVDRPFVIVIIRDALDEAVVVVASRLRISLPRKSERTVLRAR